MAMRADPAHLETDKIIENIEKKIAKEYKQAHKEVTKKVEDYFDRFAEKDKKWAQAVADGKKTAEDYANWRKGQMLVGDRWKDLKDTLAQDYTNASKIAQSIATGYKPEVYAINHNYATFEIEQKSQIDTSYTLYSRETVERMYRDNPKLYHNPGESTAKDIREGKVKRWNKQKVQSVITQGILQGESIPKLAKRLEKVTQGGYSAAVRNARTMMTGVQNAGRIDAQNRAKSMGIPVQKQWLATLDSRTRHWHRDLDGEIVETEEPFVHAVPGNYTAEIMFPGDPSAEAVDIYNCRCTLLSAIKGMNNDVSDISERNTKHLDEATYEEWKKGHSQATGQTGQKAQTEVEPPKPLTLQDAKTFEDARAYFGAEYGITIDPSVDDLEFEHCKHAMQGIDDTMKDFPELKGQVTGLSTKKSGYMCTDGSTIKFNPSYFEKGEWYEKDVAYQAGAHEAGHCIDMLICLKAHGGSYWGARSAWNSSDEAKGILRTAVARTKKRIPEYKSITSAQMRNGMSNYSLTDTAESLAEGVGFDTLYRHRGVNQTRQAHGLELASEIVKVLKERLL